MDKKKYIRNLGISAADERTIAEKIQEVEAKTAGEIALALTRQSDSYSKNELLIAIVGTGIFSLLFLFCATWITDFLSFRNWNITMSPARLLLVFLVSLALVLLAIFLLINIPAVERIFLSKKTQRACVHRRAHLHFFESGLYRTKEHTGILIFISVMERMVYIYADEGIRSKVDQTVWQEICNELAVSIKHKKAGAGLVTALERCGQILAQYVPAKGINKNEQADGLVIL
ncbi:MAG: TPM domain-containing protein [Spirochaetaceae bacterium]|nr:TPM domain-containing protein [Spirochaetaceae bacterium]